MDLNGVLIAVGVAAAVAIAAFFMYPKRVENRVRTQGSGALEVEAEVREARRLVIEAIGSFGLAIGLLLTLNQLRINQETLVGTTQAQLGDRFSAAAQQLGSDNTTSQIAGIYGLESVGRIDADYASVVDQTIAAYMRGRSGCNIGQPNCARRVDAPYQFPDPAMQAAATVLGRISGRTWMLDLRGANLSGLDLSDGNYRHADLTDANLRYAKLTGAHLEGANLRGAQLRGAVGQNAVHSDEETRWP